MMAEFQIRFSPQLLSHPCRRWAGSLHSKSQGCSATRQAKDPYSVVTSGSQPEGKLAPFLEPAQDRWTPGNHWSTVQELKKGRVTHVAYVPRRRTTKNRETPNTFDLAHDHRRGLKSTAPLISPTAVHGLDERRGFGCGPDADEQFPLKELASLYIGAHRESTETWTHQQLFPVPAQSLWLFLLKSSTSRVDYPTSTLLA